MEPPDILAQGRPDQFRVKGEAPIYVEGLLGDAAPRGLSNFFRRSRAPYIAFFHLVPCGGMYPSESCLSTSPLRFRHCFGPCISAMAGRWRKSSAQDWMIVSLISEKR